MTEPTREQLTAWRDGITSFGIIGTVPTGGEVVDALTLALEALDWRNDRLILRAVRESGLTAHDAQCCALYYKGVEDRHFRARDCMQRLSGAIATALRSETP